MAETFIDGERKVRPNAYFQVKNGAPVLVEGINGVVSAVFKADWGPLGEVVELVADQGYEDTYGTGGTTDLLKYAFEGGATKIYCYRTGSGGSASTITLKNETGEDAVKISARHPGARNFTVTVQDMLEDPTLREIKFFSGTTQYEKIIIDKGGDEIANLVHGLSENDSFIGEAVEGDKTDTLLAEVAEAEMTAGTDPTYEVGDYAKALEALEPYWANVTLVDTNDVQIHALVKAHCEQMYKFGILTQAVFAERLTVERDNRIKRALGYNSEQIDYVLNPRAVHRASEIDPAVTVDGYQTAALIGGYIAGVECNKSLTHQTIPQLTKLIEPLTNNEMIYAEKRGCLVLSYNRDKEVWIDNAINTLVDLPDDRDAGWKKIRRTKTRYEMMYRMNTVAENLVGKVDNDPNGRATIIANLQAIGDDMINEGKLTQVKITESTKYKADGDSCWFDIDTVDKDSAEHIYLTYYFHFSTNV